MSTLFLNQDAVNLNDLFLNEDWKLVQIYKNIYNLLVKGKELGWIVKVYEKKKYAKQESIHLNKLKKYSGFPKVLATGFSRTLNYNVLSKEKGQDLYEYGCEKTFSITEIKNIAVQLLKLLVKMQEKNIVHGDIKPENIIYNNKTRKVSIIDFEGKYTKEYASPEQIFGGKVSYKTDVWSVGVLLYWLASKTHPFKNFKELKDKRVKYPREWSKEFQDFLSCLIERDLTLRYDCHEALNHPWIQE